jgi:hypothetical protein
MPSKNFQNSLREMHKSRRDGSPSRGDFGISEQNFGNFGWQASFEEVFIIERLFLR